MKKKSLLFAAAVVAGIVVIWLAAGHGGDLEAVSRPICSTANWLRSHDPAREPDYAWLNDHELISCQTVSSQNCLIRLNVVDGRTTILNRLTDKSGRNLPGLDSGFRLSPDGSAILWHSPEAERNHPQWFVQRIGSNGLQTRPMEESFRDYPNNSLSWSWIPDGQTWLSIDKPNAVGRVYNADPAKSSTRIPISAPVPDHFGFVEIAGISPSNTVFATTWLKGQDLYLLKFRIGERPESAQTVHISVPYHANVPETVLSPDSKTLAWIFFHEKADPPLARWWNSVLGRETDPAYVTEIWLSNSDGTKMRKIGGIEFNQRPGGYKFAHDLRWLPESKRISFIMEGRLRVVEVQ